MTIDTRLAELVPDAARSAERIARIREQVLARAVVDPTPARRPPQLPSWRWMVGGVIAATAAVALVVGPVLVPDSDTFAANALTPLAKAAEQTEVPPLTDGRVLHRTTEYRTTEAASGKVTVMQWEEWTLEDGTFYRRVTVDGTVEPVQLWDTVGSSDLTPRQIADLPSDPEDLLAVIEKSPQGSLTQQVLGTILYGGYAPTDVWAAAIEAYGSLPGVQVRVDEAANRTFVTEEVKGGPLTMLFDSATGQLLGYDSTSTQDGGRTETMRVTLSQVEQGVPGEIVDGAQKRGY